jgi:uncharacterized protein YndB with AHSA1/START domain
MDAMAANAESSADREIVIARLIDAPPARVFDAWTDPQQVVQWWGPRGFTTTTSKMDVKPGGLWGFVMHGPDGRDYQNRITYLEVVKPERLVYKHGGDEDLEPVSFQTTVTFVPQGSKTMVTMLAVFPTAKSFVIDSSKMPKRLSYLMRLEEADVYPCISSATQGADQLGGSQARRLPQAYPPL